MTGGDRRISQMCFGAGVVAAALAATPAQAQTALTSEEASRIINGPCAQTRAIAAAIDFSVVGLSWPKKAANFEAELPADLAIDDLKGRIAQSENSIKYYYDDYAGKLDDYQLCLRQNKLSVALSRSPISAALPAPIPVPATAPAPVVAMPVSAPQPVQQTFTVLSPGITIERRETAYDAVSAALQTALSGDLSTASSGSKLLDRVMASLTDSLKSGGGLDLLGANSGLLETLLGEVRSALGTNLPSSANQLADLALGELKRALNKPRINPQASVVAAAMSNPIASQSGSRQRNLSATALPAIFLEFGETVNLVETPSGVQFTEKNNHFFVYLNGCTQGARCTSVYVGACFEVDFASLGKVNAWNRDKLNARAFVDSRNRLCVDDVVYALDGVIDVKYLGLSVAKFRVVTGDLNGNFNTP